MCSTFGIKDFPIVNSVPVVPSLNASIYEEVPLDIQWGPIATAPTFITDGAFANLGLIGPISAASSTTLRLQGNSFSLLSVQLCEPQHKSLLPMSKQMACSGELILSFKAQTDRAENYIFLCVPILAQATATPSAFLEALRLGRLDGKPTSLLTVLPPEDKHYISYSTCLRRTEGARTTTKQARVLVYTAGLRYPNANLTELARKRSGPSRTNPPVLPAMQMPDSLVKRTESQLTTITTEENYKSLLRYSQYYPTTRPDSSRYRTDRLESYKCVPLEPSQNIKDGRIVVDTESGELLSQVVKDAESGEVRESKLTPALIEKIIAVIVALVLLAIVLLVLAYILASMTTPNADTFFGIVKQHLGTIAPVVFFSLLLGIVGFLLGVFLMYMV